MAYSKIQPADRPYKILCRICNVYEDTKLVKDPIQNWPPENFEKCIWIHTKCGSKKGYVYEFESDEERLAKKNKNIPHCGNEKCEGYCDDPLCVPPIQTALLSTKEEKKKTIIIVNMIPPALSIAGACFLIWPIYSFWSFPISCFLILLALAKISNKDNKNENLGF